MYKIEGLHSIEHALRNCARSVERIYLTKNHYNMLSSVIPRHIPYTIHSQSFILCNEIYIPMSLSDIISKYNRIILLDGLQDPHNIGSIIRTAAVLNFAVLIRNAQGCGVTETVVKCAAGGVDVTGVATINQLKNVIDILKENEFWVCGLIENTQSNYITLNDLREYKKVVIIIGSEGSGMRSLTKKLCDFTHTIKGKFEFNVLNAANTAAIAMYTCREYHL